MSHVLAIASDFIERMANPGYGIRMNEDYAIRFGTFLSSENFNVLLRHEIEEIKDEHALTPHGWLWVLGVARANGIDLDDDLLLNLAEEFSSVFMQVLVIDLATRHSEMERPESAVTLSVFDHEWLSELLSRCTKIQGMEKAQHDSVDTSRSEKVLVALMQVGSDITIAAASWLLNHTWLGQSQLVEYFWSLCNELDDETRQNWVSRLHPPERQSNDRSRF